MATHQRPQATHKFVENNGDDCPLFVHRPGVFYALNSMDTFIVDTAGVCWKHAARTDLGAQRIPLSWSEPVTYGLPSGGFIEPIPADELSLYANPVAEDT